MPKNVARISKYYSRIKNTLQLRNYPCLERVGSALRPVKIKSRLLTSFTQRHDALRFESLCMIVLGNSTLASSLLNEEPYTYHLGSKPPKVCDGHDVILTYTL